MGRAGLLSRNGPSSWNVGAAPAPIVLIIEDDDASREMLADSLIEFGYSVMTAPSAEAGIQLMDAEAPDLVLSDVHMGGMSGIELCAALKANPRFQLTPVVLLTGISDREARIAGLAAGADDLFAKPVDVVELRTRVVALLRVKVLLDQLEEVGSVITTLGLTIEARDPYTAGHCERLAILATALGRALDAEAPMIQSLQLGGFLHDLGKIEVPDRVLLKPGPLDADERLLIERHPVVGENLVKGLKSLAAVLPLIRHHHERWDGSGYPDRLGGEAIPLGARIMAIVDVYDALITARPYKRAFSHDDALSILRAETDRGLWDPEITRTFVETLKAQGLSRRVVCEAVPPLDPDEGGTRPV